MKIELSKEKFEIIDSAFAKLKTDRKNRAAVGTIRRALQEVFVDKEIDVQIIENLRGKFFIMSVYPDESTVERIIEAIVNNENDAMIKAAWDETNKWTIEIDSRILTDDKVHATSKELTALLLHEMGHIIYSNSIPQRISRVMRLEYNRAAAPIKELLKDKLFGAVLKLPILNACVYDNYKTKNNIKDELKADVFVVKMGYKDELASVLDKMILASKDPKVTQIDNNSDKVYDDMKSITMFSIGTIEDLQKRQNALVKKNFNRLLVASPSAFIQKTVKSISDAFIKQANNKLGKSAMTESMFEDYINNKIDRIIQEHYSSYVDHDDIFINESFFTKKLKPIDPACMDYVEMQKENIKNNDDKMMLVSYIYSKLDIIDYYLSIINNNVPKYIVPHSKQSLLDMRERLTAIKDEVVAYKIPEIKYGLFIDYPKGYEG